MISSQAILISQLPQPSGQAGCRIEGHTLQKCQAVGTRQEATPEGRDHLKTDINNINDGTEATAFVFTDPLIEGECARAQSLVA